MLICTGFQKYHDLLHRKGIKTNDYLAQIMEPGAPVNEIGLLIFSRMYHIHIHVLLNGYFWTTNKPNEDFKRLILHWCTGEPLYLMIQPGKLWTFQ